MWTATVVEIEDGREIEIDMIWMDENRSKTERKAEQHHARTGQIVIIASPMGVDVKRFG